MSELKQKCQVDCCNRAAFAHCFCCDKDVCTRHFTEHVNTVRAQVEPLSNEINEIVEEIHDLTIEQITEASFNKLHQWKVDMHLLIDEIFSAKTKEIHDLIEKNKNKFDEYKNQLDVNIIKIQDDVKQLIEDGDATSEQIQLLRNQLTNVKTNLTSFQTDFLSIEVKLINDDLVTVTSKINESSTSVRFSFNLGNETSTFPTSSNYSFGLPSCNFSDQGLQTDKNHSKYLVRTTYIRKR